MVVCGGNIQLGGLCRIERKAPGHPRCNELKIEFAVLIGRMFSCFANWYFKEWHNFDVYIRHRVVGAETASRLEPYVASVNHTLLVGYIVLLCFGTVEKFLAVDLSHIAER